MSQSQTHRTAVLRNIWCDVLAVSDVSAGDNFFSLGGTSLDAMTLISRIWDQLGMEISLEELYDDGSFEALVSRSVIVDATDAAPVE